MLQSSRRLTRPFTVAIQLLDAIPYSVVALIARLATFSVFFRSGTQKLSDWHATLLLFENEYHVPLLSPDFAAYLAAGLELSCSVLILVGLMTRFATIVLCSMIAVIQVFIYPSAWPDHIQYVAFMSIIIARGPGRLSLDYLLSRHLSWLPTSSVTRPG
jgi:putative oxidoreductase